MSEWLPITDPPQVLSNLGYLVSGRFPGCRDRAIQRYDYRTHRDGRELPPGQRGKNLGHPDLTLQGFVPTHYLPIPDHPESP